MGERAGFLIAGLLCAGAGDGVPELGGAASGAEGCAEGDGGFIAVGDEVDFGIVGAAVDVADVFGIGAGEGEVGRDAI